MWFVSGLVMIYVPYPSLSPAEKLAGAQAIDWQRVDALPPIGGRMPAHLALEMRDGVPVWRIDGWNGKENTVPASATSRLAPVDAAMARRVAGSFGASTVRAVEQIERDQWTVAGGFDKHRPLWRADLADDLGTSLYVSSGTGEVVQKTTRRNRFWNWLGSVPHWIYPTLLRQDGPAWRQVVMWVSGPCIAAAVTGIWIGILRTRLGKRRFKGGRATPYQGWMLWHHLAGLLGGFFLLAWIFSGWLSVDPFRLFHERPLDEAAARHYATASPVPPLRLPMIAAIGHGAKRIEMTDNAGRPLLVIYYADGRRDIRDAASLSPAVLPATTIASAAKDLVPEGRLVGVDRITSPDAYWYEAGDLPQLPILRLRFDDAERTWLHIDPATGAVLDTLDARGRSYRWLFDLLHKWDLNALTLHRPLWDFVLWGLSIVGLVTSLSGVWIGWRRLSGRR
jgi:hypothetical protein